jgi:uncharacterized protein (DUF952 family)
VEAFGGRISLDSPPGTGTALEIALPLDDQAGLLPENWRSRRSCSASPVSGARRAATSSLSWRHQGLYIGWVVVYKILLPEEWDEFEAAGQFDGSTFDRDSGFIHLSSREQVAETARRVFSDQPVLVVVAIDDSLVDGSVRWETTSNHGRFPHLYGALPRTAVVATVVVAGASDIEDALAR